MLFVANYTMKGSLQALIATILLAMLSVFFSPFGVLLGAVIALVTLRVGGIDGFKTLMAAMVTSFALSSFVLGNTLTSVLAVFEYMLPVWIIALVLRKTNSLSSAIHVSMLMAGGSIAVFHLFVGDTVTWWSELFNSVLLPVMTEAEMEIPAEAVENIANIATLVFGMSAIFLWVSIAFIARWWQSQLYYPGKFGESFYQVRLPSSIAYLAIVVIIASLVVKSAFIQDLAGVMTAGLLLVGLAIAHHAISIKKMSKAWLVSLYVLLVLFPQTILIVSAIGLADIWLNIRSQWTKD